MIIVQGYIPIKPAHREEVLRMAREMTSATRAEEGCISYEFFVGLSDPNTLLLFQEWESMEALMGHFQTSHTEQFMEALPNLLSGEVITRRYAVQSVEEETETRSAPVIH